MLEALIKWEDKLLGRKFVLVTDHTGLEYFETQKTLWARQVQWWEFLSRFDYSTLLLQPRNINSELRTPIHPTLVQDSIPSSPLVQPCTNTFPIFRSDPTPPLYPPFRISFTSIASHYLVVPCPLLGDACLFPSYSYPIPQTSVQPLQTFLICPQYLPDLDSHLFSFHTDFECYTLSRSRDSPSSVTVLRAVGLRRVHSSVPFTHPSPNSVPPTFHVSDLHFVSRFRSY